MSPNTLGHQCALSIINSMARAAGAAAGRGDAHDALFMIREHRAYHAAAHTAPPGLGEALDWSFRFNSSLQWRGERSK